MKTKLFICFPCQLAKQTAGMRHKHRLDVSYGSFHLKMLRLPTSRCHGVPQAMDESYTILVQQRSTSRFFSAAHVHIIALSINKGKGVGSKNSALQYHTTRPHVRVASETAPPPPFLCLFRCTSRQTRRDHLLRSVEFTRALAPFPR